MAFSRRALLRCLVLVSLALLPLGMATDPIGIYCTGASYAKGSKGFANINSVVSDLAAKGSTTGFATSSVGKGNNVIYGLAQCRGDVPDSDCAACLAGAASQIATSCNYPSDARIWYDYCFMRYKNEDFIGQTDADTGASVIFQTNVQELDNPKKFQKAVGKAMGKAVAATGSGGGLGRAKEQYTPFVSIYALAQCTRDLPTLSCAQCLSTAVSNIGGYCGAAEGCQINFSSCRVRYEINPFYFPLAGGRATTDMTKYTKVVVAHP